MLDNVDIGFTADMENLLNNKQHCLTADIIICLSSDLLTQLYEPVISELQLTQTPRTLNVTLLFIFIKDQEYLKASADFIHKVTKKSSVFLR